MNKVLALTGSWRRFTLILLVDRALLVEGYLDVAAEKS